MKRFMSIALVAGLVLGAGSMAFANICAFDPVPAATLLFPFVALERPVFEEDAVADADFTDVVEAAGKVDHVQFLLRASHLVLI